MRCATFIAALLAGCSTGGGDVQSSCPVGTDTQPLTRACYPDPVEVVSTPESPDYGRVPCVVIDAGPAETPFCECAQPGFRPASDEQAALARDQLEAGGVCAGDCCDEFCFCELQQFSGETLAYCQDRASEPPPAQAANGWCYIEPGAGFGDASRVDECPPTQQQLVRFLPDDALKNRHVATFACLGERQLR